MNTYGCIDLGGSSTRIALVKSDGTILTKTEIDIGGVAFQKEKLLVLVKNALLELLKRNSVVITCWTVAVPCIVDPSTNVFSFASNISTDLSAQDFQQLFLSCQVDEPTYFINDVHAAALCEIGYGHLCDIENAIYLNIGTGLSSVIIIGSKIYSGSNHAAGEIAFWYDTDRTAFIEKGKPALEQFVSGRAIENAIFKYYKDHNYKFSVPFSLKKLNISDFKEEGIQKILIERFEKLAVHLFNMATLLNPQRIVIGGVVTYLKDIFMPIISEVMKKILFEVDVLLVQKLEDTGILGCAYYGIKKGKICE